MAKPVGRPRNNSHIESGEEIRVISMRKADSDETDLYYKNAGYF